MGRDILTEGFLDAEARRRGGRRGVQMSLEAGTILESAEGAETHLTRRRGDAEEDAEFRSGSRRVVNCYRPPPLADRVSAPSAFEPEERDTPDSLSKTPRFPPRLRASASSVRPTMPDSLFQTPRFPPRLRASASSIWVPTTT